MVATFPTSFNSGHRHRWFKGDKFTLSSSGHKHKIDMQRRLALPIRKKGHIHTL